MVSVCCQVDVLVIEQGLVKQGSVSGLIPSLAAPAVEKDVSQTECPIFTLSNLCDLITPLWVLEEIPSCLSHETLSTPS